MADKNLKVGVSADTRDFSKGMKTAKQDLKDFQKVGDNVMGALGDAMGVPVQKLERIGGAAREMGKRLQESEGAGTKALGKLLSGTNALALGVAGVGVAALTAAFKALNAAADNFLNTVDGLSTKMQTDQWMATYKQSAFDSASGLGGTFAAWRSEFKQFSAELALGMFGGSKAAANEAAYQAHLQSQAILGLKNSEKDLYDLDVKIAAARLKAYDTKNQEDINTLVDLINQKYALQEPYLKEIYETTKAINATSGNTLADVDKENEAYKNWQNLSVQKDNELKALLKLQKSVTSELGNTVQKEDEALRIMKEWKQEMQDVRNANLDWFLNTSTPSGAGLNPGAQSMKVSVPVVPEFDQKQVEQTVLEMSSVIEDAFSSTCEVLGELFGNLLTGGDAFKSFGNSAMSAMADMAISVGKIAIATGVATLGIKAALESLNGWAAIAAGTALVALGAAVKSGLSNAASGGIATSGGASVASGSYGNSGRDYTTREMTVNVTGKLQANGSTLEAVLESNNNRRKHTV